MLIIYNNAPNPDKVAMQKDYVLPRIVCGELMATEPKADVPVTERICVMPE